MKNVNWAIESAGFEANFIANMKRIREEKGWSQGDLADRMTESGWEGFHQTTISRIEKGTRPVRLGESTGIAAALGALVSQMLLPMEDAKVLRNLELEVLEAESRGRRIAEDVRMYMFNQSCLKMLLEDVESVVIPERADQVVSKNLEIYTARARAIMDKPYYEHIREFMETENPPSDYESDDD